MCLRFHLLLLYILITISGIQSDTSITLKPRDPNQCGPPIEVPVLHEESLNISVKLDNVKSIKCQNLRYRQNQFQSSSDLVIIRNITEACSGTWMCEILTDKGKCKCSVKIYVRYSESSSYVALNNMKLNSTLAPPNVIEYDHLVKYKYENNDTVDVVFYRKKACAPGSVIEFKIKHNLFDRDLAENDLKTTIGFTASIILEDKHDNHYIDFITRCSKKSYETIRLSFILVSNYKTRTELKVNNRTVKLYDDELNPSMKTKVMLLFFNQTYIEMTGVNCSILSNNCNTEINKSYISWTAEINTCNIVYKCQAQILDLVITNINVTMVSSSSMEFRVHDINAIAEIHAMGGFNVYYYDIDPPMEHVTVTCSKSKSVTGYHIVTKCNDQELQKDEGNMSTMFNVTLKSNQVECFFQLQEQASSDITEKNIVRFRRKIEHYLPYDNTKLTHSSSSTVGNRDSEIQDNINTDADRGIGDVLENNIYISVGVVIAILIICTALILYRKKKQKQTESVVALGDDTVTDTELPPHSQQCTPKLDEEYSEPFGRLPIYATAVPKHLRQRPEENPESEVYSVVYSSLEKKFDSDQLPYAELHIVNKISDNQEPSSAEASYVNKRQELDESTYAEVREMYGKVLPKSKRKQNKDATTYANCYPDSPYVNSGNNSKSPEYVEPTYIQAHLTQLKK